MRGGVRWIKVHWYKNFDNNCPEIWKEGVDQERLLYNFKNKCSGIRAAYARRVSVREEGFGSVTTWMQGRSRCKSACDLCKQPCTVGAWNVRLLWVYLGKPEKSISLGGRQKQPAESSQTDTFVLFVSTALICRAGSMTTRCLQRVSTRCSWFFKLMNISCVKQPSLKSVTSEPRLQMCLSLSPSVEMKSVLFCIFRAKHPETFLHCVISLWELLFKAKQDI